MTQGVGAHIIEQRSVGQGADAKRIEDQQYGSWHGCPDCNSGIG
jgi:hypothetical protein